MTLQISRRRLLVGSAALIAAPAIVRASSIMPVRALVPEISGTSWDHGWSYIKAENVWYAKWINQFDKWPAEARDYHGGPELDIVMYGTTRIRYPDPEMA